MVVGALPPLLHVLTATLLTHCLHFLGYGFDEDERKKEKICSK